MKLSDEKLSKLLEPLITKEVGLLKLEKITVTGDFEPYGAEIIVVNLYFYEADYYLFLKNSLSTMSLRDKINDVVYSQDDIRFVHLILNISKPKLIIDPSEDEEDESLVPEYGDQTL